MDIEVPLLQTYVEGLVHDPLRDHQGSRELERIRGPRAGQPRGAVRPLRDQDAPTGDVPLPLLDQGARPHDVPDRRATVRLDAPRAMGGRLPRGRDPESAAGRGRGDGRAAAASLHQDALDEPRPQRARPEPRRPEGLRDPRDLEEKVKVAGACLPVGPMAALGSPVSGAGASAALATPAESWVAESPRG